MPRKIDPIDELILYAQHWPDCSRAEIACSCGLSQLIIKVRNRTPMASSAREFVDKYCTGQDDHDSSKCRKCAEMEKELTIRDAEIAREAKREVREAANLFGARVKERCPSWFEEPAGSTDFAEARDALAVLLAAPAAAQGGEEPI